MRLFILTLTLVLFASESDAHKPSDSYLSLSVSGSTVMGRWDIALRDLDYALTLDRNDDGTITWGEVRSRHKEIAAYALSRLTLTSEKTICTTLAEEQLIDHHTDGAYTVLRFTGECPSEVRTLDVDYRLFFDLDPQHKGLLRFDGQRGTQSAIFSPEQNVLHLAVESSSIWSQVADYTSEGIRHIWTGYDHMLFLLALLLPAVLRRVEDRWEPAPDLLSAFREVVAIVTAFTVAHTVTLGLATLEVIALPSRLVESAIAASVVFAGISNLYPVLARRRWLVAFLFGLVHGFGFATVLADLGLPEGSLLLSLVSFNVGVECGQLVIVSVFLPLAFWLRRSWIYPRVILVPGSLIIAGLAFLWLLERAWDLKLSVL